MKNGRYREDNIEFWYFNDELHREDGPALEYADGTKVWYLNGKLHRENGPAIEFPDGSKSWFLNGSQYSESEFKHWLEKKNLNKRLQHTLEEKPSVKKVKI